MKLEDVPQGHFVTRNYVHAYSSNLCILHTLEGEFHYYSDGKPSSIVNEQSSAWKRTDFIYCDIHANKLKANPAKEKQMDNLTTSKREDATIVVMNQSGKLNAFANEDDAMEFIGDKLQENPRTRFSLFEMYGEIKPKKFDLKELFHKVTKKS